jgi:dolichol-phosphate mannosyltransferase
MATEDVFDDTIQAGDSNSSLPQQTDSRGTNVGTGRSRGASRSGDGEESSVTVIVPTYNERENVVSAVGECLDALSDRRSEVVVVDDDSPDRTWAVAEEAFADDERVTVVRRRFESDLSTAVLRGFERANGEYCAVIDADLQHPPGTLPALIEALDEGADLAVGSRRTVANGETPEGLSGWRTLVSRGATVFSKALVPQSRTLTDPMSGLFAVRRGPVLDETLDPKGYKILLELLAQHDFDRITEIPYTFRERQAGESNLTPVEYWKFARHVVYLGWRDRSDLLADSPLLWRIGLACALVLSVIEFMQDLPIEIDTEPDALADERRSGTESTDRPTGPGAEVPCSQR